MKSRAERRHDDWTKAIRKRNIDRDLQSSSFCYDWYDNLHQYSKNKIHCSCSLCRAKTRNKKYSRRKSWTPSVNWDDPDMKKIIDMKEQLDEGEVDI